MLREIVLQNDLNYFLTLTLDPSKVPEPYLSPVRNRTHKYITKLFNHFMTVLKRKEFTYFDSASNKWKTYHYDKSKIPIKYAWVMEFQKNGNAHLHILLNQFLPIDVIREIWTHVGGGHIMKVEHVKSLYAISLYLTDYIVKGIKDISTEKSGFKYFERRYSISRSCTRKRLVFGNVDNAPEIKKHLQERGLDWISKYLYNPIFTDLTVNLTPLPHE